jgi:hypothetical protein
MIAEMNGEIAVTVDTKDARIGEIDAKIGVIGVKDAENQED